MAFVTTKTNGFWKYLVSFNDVL